MSQVFSDKNNILFIVELSIVLLFRRCYYWQEYCLFWSIFRMGMFNIVFKNKKNKKLFFHYFT